MKKTNLTRLLFAGCLQHPKRPLKRGSVSFLDFLWLSVGGLRLFLSLAIAIRPAPPPPALRGRGDSTGIWKGGDLCVCFTLQVKVCPKEMCVCLLGEGGGGQRHRELVENEQLETLPGEREL